MASKRCVCNTGVFTRSSASPYDKLSCCSVLQQNSAYETLHHAPCKSVIVTIVCVAVRSSHACRQSEVNKKRELNMQADVKRAEIACVHKILHRSKIANFIQTSASPPLCWLPGKHNTATQALLQQEQAKLDVYKVRAEPGAQVGETVLLNSGMCVADMQKFARDVRCCTVLAQEALHLPPSHACTAKHVLPVILSHLDRHHAFYGAAHVFVAVCRQCECQNFGYSLSSLHASSIMVLTVLQQEEADKVEAKRQQVVAAVASMAAALEAADARRREAALNPPRPVAAPSAAAVGETDAANAGADAAAPMQADDIETADQEDAEPGLCHV